KNTQSIKQIKIYAKEIPYLYLPSPLAFKIVETNTSDIGSNLKQLVDNKEQLVQLPALYSVFYVVYLMTPNSILTKDVNKLFQDYRKLYLIFEANQIHYQSLSPTEIKKNMSDTLSPTEIKKNMIDALFLILIKTLSVQIPLTDKLLFNNSNPTHPSSYKKILFDHSFIEKPRTMETLSFDRATERTRKRKLPSPTEIEETEKKIFIPH
ncbi:hypothetical protein CFOL_v3_32882, partial [Cephalotus follicularis]